MSRRGQMFGSAGASPSRMTNDGLKKMRDDQRETRVSKMRTARREPGPRAARTVPEIYEVVIECRHEAEQRAVYERMCGEGFRCRVMTL